MQNKLDFRNFAQNSLHVLTKSGQSEVYGRFVPSSRLLGLKRPSTRTNRVIIRPIGKRCQLLVEFLHLIL